MAELSLLSHVNGHRAPTKQEAIFFDSVYYPLLSIDFPTMVFDIDLIKKLQNYGLCKFIYIHDYDILPEIYEKRSRLCDVVIRSDCDLWVDLLCIPKPSAFRDLRAKLDDQGIRTAFNSCDLFNEQLTHVDQTSTVVDIMLNQFPIPADDVTWEQIIEFKNEEQSKSAIINLRRFIGQLVRNKASAVEIEEELDFLLQKYKARIELHKRRFTLGGIRSLLVTVGEAAENIAKLRVGELMKTLCTIGERKLMLTEAELNTPGKELAYIVRANDRFT